jgi:CheY-like chemotaxis protein
MCLRVVIVDDNKSFLDVAKALLEREGLPVVGVAGSVESALQCCEQAQPDVVLVDIVLAGESGFELTRRLAACERSGSPVAILISTHAEEDFADLIADSPAAAFLSKSDLSAAAIRRVCHGEPG